ncbi:hypothetical protein IFM89_023659 [Coptis chinensis]|uniref:Domain X domain-containing protein n=1 Tax=Coptis chinensis TaxID=261450 RepID=A0A835LWX2_9MAGN|nr:hypothetical protein IFM89_023659 [Coptis chinensis]
MFHATQAHTNAQMNKFLGTMVVWYRYTDNQRKVVNFCSYIMRGSLAKLYAAKYKLRSRAKVYKIASRNLSRPLLRKKGQSPEYHKANILSPIRRTKIYAGETEGDEPGNLKKLLQLLTKLKTQLASSQKSNNLTDRDVAERMAESYHRLNTRAQELGAEVTDLRVKYEALDVEVEEVQPTECFCTFKDLE